MAIIKIEDINNNITIDINKEDTDMTITNIKEFANAIAKVINETQNKYEASVAEVVKMNDEKLYGVTLKTEGSDAAPTCYIDGAYEEYKDGCETLDSIADELIRQADGLQPFPAIPTKMQDFSFDAVQDKLSIRVAEIQRNKEFFEKTPYKKDYFGLGLGMMADINFNHEYRTAVNEQLMEQFNSEGHSKAEVLMTALRNASKINPPKFSDMMGAMFGGGKNLLDDKDYEWDNDGSMFVLTNESGIFGASALFYPGVIDRISEILGVGFYILPSSVHEVIILPDIGQHNAEDLKNMVMQANRTVVEPKDVLSDNVWYYNYNFDEIQIVA